MTAEVFAGPPHLEGRTSLRERVVDMLNALLMFDPEGMQRLLDTRIEINEALAADQIWPVVSGTNKAGRATLGPLGLIQGVLRLEDSKAEPITAVYTDDLSKLLGFK